MPEFLQEEATPGNLAQAVTNLLFDPVVRQRLEARFEKMAGELRCDAANAAAAAVLPLLDGARA